MLTIVVSCIITVGLSFTPVPPWTVEKIEGPSQSNILWLCSTYPCPAKLTEHDKPRFLLRATLDGHEQLDVPFGCTLVSLKQEEKQR